ncbi:MAG: hypothetical protein PHV06_03435, partial [bacterium]|nr:hypothetical protein [bacterium]
MNPFEDTPGSVEVISFTDLTEKQKDYITENSPDQRAQSFEPVAVAVIEPEDIVFDWLGNAMCIYFPKDFIPLGTHTQIRYIDPGPIEIIYTLSWGIKYGYATNAVLFYNGCGYSAQHYYTLGSYTCGPADDSAQWQQKIDQLIEYTKDFSDNRSFVYQVGGCDFNLVAKLSWDKLTGFTSREVKGKDIIILFEREIGYNSGDFNILENSNCESLGLDESGNDVYELSVKIKSPCSGDGIKGVPVFFKVLEGDLVLEGNGIYTEYDSDPVYPVRSNAEGIASIKVIIPESNPTVLTLTSVPKERDPVPGTGKVESFLATDPPDTRLVNDIPCGANLPDLEIQVYNDSNSNGAFDNQDIEINYNEYYPQKFTEILFVKIHNKRISSQNLKIKVKLKGFSIDSNESSFYMWQDNNFNDEFIIPPGQD